MAAKRSLLSAPRRAHALSSATLNLAQLWFEALSFPLLYLYLGRPNLSLIVDPLSEKSEFDLIPDILATSLYAFSLMAMTEGTKQSKDQPGLLVHSQHLALSHTLMPLGLLALMKVASLGL